MADFQSTSRVGNAVLPSVLNFFENSAFEEKPMSTPTTRANQPKKRHVIMTHAKRPHGIALIGIVLFVVAWVIWTTLVL
jgi:hypothetical protein